MPIKPENRHLYPPNWNKISRHIRFVRADNKCEVCGAVNYEPHPVTGSKVILTTAHLDHDPTNNRFSNLKAMCQRCHLTYDAKHHAKNAAITRQKQQRRLFQ